MTTFKYPVEAANGNLVLSNNPSAEAIKQVIQTRKGERVMRNYFGTEVEELITITELGTTLGTMEQDIENATDEYQPLNVTLEGSVFDDGSASINVYYTDSLTEGSFDTRL
jgi:phage baseplate assembly protein W